MSRRERALQVIAIAVWTGALVMALLLALQMNSLSRSFDARAVQTHEMAVEAKKLGQSTDRLGDSVHRFVERVQEQQAAPASSK